MKKLLLLHGAIGAQDHLQPLATLLAGEYELLPFHFSGHGGKPFNDPPFSIPSFAAEVNEYLDDIGAADIHIFGYSMGGYVALYLAKNYPDKIKKIVTLATKFHWDEETAHAEIKMLDPGKIEEKIPAFAAALQKRHHPNDWKELLNKTKEMLIEMGSKKPLQLSDYADIKTPCRLIIGDKDRMVSLEETLNVFKALPNAEMAMLPRSSHPIEQTNIEALSFLIKQFV